MSLLLLGVMAFTFRQSTFPPTSTNQEIASLQTFSDLERGHLETMVNYRSFPPVGGMHSPHWYNAGIYDKPVPLEKVVHTLEHGAVWLTYDPSLNGAEVRKLRSLAKGRPCTVVAPFFAGGLKTKIAAVAWGNLLELDNAYDPRIPQFIVRFERGPQSPEPGAACKGDEGSPVE